MADLRTKINTLTPRQAVDSLRMYKGYLEGMIETFEKRGDADAAKVARDSLTGLECCIDLALTDCEYIETHK